MDKGIKEATKNGSSKRFVALARVSSREQQREGFSLDVQEEALKNYATRAGGTIIKLYRIAETASKSDERKTFKELIAYAKAHADMLHGLLFYKVDRAARNLFDYVELERLEGDYGIRFISVSQPTESTPAGRMQRRMLASMASSYTEQQSLDVREGLKQRAESGLFVGHTPYGYRNVRVDGRSIIEVDEIQARNVRQIFHLYAYEHCTLDGIVQRLTAAQVPYRTDKRAWVRSKIHLILRDRSYLGELPYLGQWLAGAHPPLIDRSTWDRVQILLGGATYKSHDLVYGGELIRCAHCEHPITGEVITKRSSGKQYRYYRCSKYNSKNHPRIRVSETELDEQILGLFGKIKQPEETREWFAKMLRLWAKDQQQQSRSSTDIIQRDLSVLRGQQDRLLNLRLLEEINADTFAAKNTELRDRIARLTLQLEAADRGRDEQADLATKVFELSQSLQEKWLTADCQEKRQILEMVCLNFSLDGVTLVPTMRKPFDVLAKGLLVQSSRGDRI